MATYYQVHPQNPQPRTMRQVADAMHKGAVVAYPTDACYVLGFNMDDKDAADRVRQIRKLDENHPFTLQAATIAQISPFVRMDNNEFKFINNLTPGPYTFLMNASRELPKRLWDQKRRTCGVRIPDHNVVRVLLESYGEPVMSTTLQMPGSDFPLIDASEVDDQVGKLIDIIVDAGPTAPTYSTVIDCTVWPPLLVREGIGEIPNGVEAA